jgi:large subunit ribosomal protein L24
MKIRRGDRVVILSGKDKGKSGEVVRAMPKDNRVVVEGINRVKRHQRTTQTRKRAGIIEKDLPVPVSVVAIECPKEHVPTRIGYRLEDDGTKKRVCSRCGEGL